jgi:monoamine oxidase
MLQRRKFIKSLAIAIPGMILLPEFLQSCHKSTDLKQSDWKGKIIIIGAGAAGIYAAHLLLQSLPNATIQLLEANDTYGGRIKPLKGFTDFDVELGAEEVHGAKSKWHDIVASTNANLFTSPASELDFIMLGSSLKDEDVAASNADFTLAQSAVNSVVKYSGTDIDCEAYAISKSVGADGMPYFNALTGNEYGTSANRLSAVGIAKEDDLWTSGDTNYNVSNRTYYSILEEKLGDAIQLARYNTQIKSIDYTNDSILLTDQTGLTYTADKVVVTVPLTVLKAADITFNPVLSDSKKNAIQKIGMGAGMKVILKFSNRFWNVNTGSIYGKGIVPEYWYVAKGRGSEHVLTAFIMGEKAEYLSSQGAGAIALILADLDLMYGAGKASGSIINSHIEDWSKNEFIKGAYSFAAEADGIALRTALAETISKKIYFAGEATHMQGHNSTVHGAIETGERVAKNIIDDVTL